MNLNYIIGKGLNSVQYKEKAGNWSKKVSAMPTQEVVVGKWLKELQQFVSCVSTRGGPGNT
jgi:hypothetical protein